MSVSLVLVVLAAAFLHAFWNALVKGSAEKTIVLGLIAMGHVVPGIAITALAPLPGWSSVPYIIASTLIVLALFLMLAERRGRRELSMQNLSFWQIQIIGLCQALALVPGCSRSGSTIMGGLFIGLKREEAARFSFLLGLPAIGASGLLEFLDLLEGGLAGTGLINLGLGILAAAVSGYLSIGFLLRFLQRHGTNSFSVYRILLGGVILYSIYG